MEKTASVHDVQVIIIIDQYFKTCYLVLFPSVQRLHMLDIRQDKLLVKFHQACLVDSGNAEYTYPAACHQ